MKTKHYFLTLLLTASFSLLFGQRNRVDYDKDTKWNFGLNAGGTWQEKELDFVNYPGFSGGLTLGRAIYEKEGRLLSFDLRGRLLLGQTAGWSTTPSYDSTLFGGVGYKNYKFQYGEGSLELVVNAHRLRERTGILLYGFGGVGLVSHSVNHNYKDGSDFYDFSSVDSTASPTVIADDLKSNFNDKNWEKNNEFFGGTQTLFMPSLGVGLGYQVTPQFSLGVEHKVTFGLNDNLDGHLDGKNDRYHYTNFNLRWNLFRGNGTGNGSYIPEERPLPNQGGNPSNPSSNGNVDDYSTPPSSEVPKGNKPLVNITRPASNGGSVYTMNYNVKAKVYYVDSKNDIAFIHNGNTVTNFSYNPSTKMVEANVLLTQGANTFVITGTNDYGSDTDTKTINYNKICNKPTITFTKPISNGKVITVASTTIKATILNVSDRNMIVFKHNGMINNNFTFNTSTKAFVANVICTEGSNVFEIEARNECGEKSNTRSIVFNEPIKNTQPPLVTITNPNVSPYTTTASNYTVGATVLYVDGASQIQYKLNGVVSNAFTYNVNTKVFSTQVNLQTGNNVVEIKATNPYGVDVKTTVIVKKPTEQVQPPVVTITYPSVSPFTVNTNTSVVNGMVYNVNSANQIQVTVNGMMLNNFVYNTSTKKISLTANLNSGSNVVMIKATNAAGVDTKSTTIIYKKQVSVLPPVVSFINPTVSPFTVNNNSYTVNAKVLNVTSANQVSVTHNGVVIPASFNNITKEVIINKTLVSGNNVFVVTGTNSAGIDTKSTTIIYKKQVVVLPPVVSFINPTVSPYTVNSNSYTVNAKVLNVTSANQVSVTHNGVVIPASFNNITKEVIINKTLVSGNNVFVVTGTNSAGIDTKSTTIIYKKQVVVLPPVVSFINPTVSPYTVNSNSYTVNAKVLNVTSANQVSVTHNGVVIPASFNNVTKEVIINKTLVSGNNVFVVTGTNSAGIDTKSTTIIYKKQVAQLPPVVTFITPQGNPFSTLNASQTITARVDNINSQSQITLNYNGSSINNFSYNGTSKMVTFNAALNVGNNTLSISASNSSGTDSKSKTIIRKKPCVAPVLAYQIPLQSPHNHVGRDGNMAFTFSSANINSVSQVKVTNNGYDVHVNLEQTNGNIWGTVPLKVGANKIVVKVKNDCGKAEKVLDVLYKGNNAKLVPPVITIQSPTSFPHTTPNASVTVSGKITNVSSQNNVQVTINGANVPFTYNTATKALTIIATNLTVGSHQVRVRATNNYGNDMEVFDIVRTGPQIKAPIVQYTNLGNSNSYRNPFVSPQRSYSVQGRVVNNQNVTLTVYVNGNRISNYSYNGSNGVFSIPVAFSLQGQGTQRRVEVEVRASNSAGQDAKKGYLVYVIQNITTNPNVNNNSGNTTTYNNYISKADSYYRKGDLNQAKVYYQKAAKVNPKASLPKQRLSEIAKKLQAKKETKPVVKPATKPTVKPSVTVEPKETKPATKPTMEKQEINKWSTKPIVKP